MSDPAETTIAPPAKATRAPRGESPAARNADTERFKALGEHAAYFTAHAADGEGYGEPRIADRAAFCLGSTALAERDAMMVAIYRAMRRIAERS